MQIPDDTLVLDLNGAMPVPAFLAQIATLLETHGSAYIHNATCPATGPGTCAMHLGYRVAKAESRPSTTEEKLNVPAR